MSNIQPKQMTKESMVEVESLTKSLANNNNYYIRVRKGLWEDMVAYMLWLHGQIDKGNKTADNLKFAVYEKLQYIAELEDELNEQH